MPKNLTVHLALFGVALIYGLNYNIAKDLTPQYILPFGVILLRAIGAVMLFWIFHAIKVKEKVQRVGDYFRFAYCGLFGVALNQLLFFKGLSITSPINASLVMTTTPILVLIISAFVLREKITWLKILGIALGMLGAGLLIGGTNFSFDSDYAFGDMLIFINALSYGTYLVLVKPLMKRYHPLTIVKWIFFFGLWMVIPFAWQEVQQVDWAALPTYSWFVLFYIIIGVTFLAYLLNAWALQFISPSIVGFYIYLQPVFATSFAILLGKDEVTLEKLGLASLIFLGVYLVSRK